MHMQNFLMTAAGAVMLAGCCLLPDAAPVPETAPETALSAAVAELPVNPSIRWGSTGTGLYIYHNVSGDCVWLEHTHGRNGAWGLWRLPLGAVSSTGPEMADGEGFAITFTCTDGSACIEAGAFDKTPDRTSAHTIPFETEQRAERYFSEVASLDKACRMLK
jgi:hypothetical protein